MISMPAPLRAAARPIVGFALPSRCPACGTVVEGDGHFCIDCWTGLDHLDQGCARCGEPSIMLADSDSLCGACLADPPPYATARAAVAYGDIARGIALRLKYSGRIGLARTIAAAMQRHMARLDDALLIPVPLHRRRIWGRGYNQAALIARALAGDDSEKLRLETLIRAKSTPVLRGMGAKAREQAVRGAFAVPDARRAEIRGRRLVLIDDVYTSGATAKACARVLLRHGAAEVHVRCWARVPAHDDAAY
ncbi:ComF family protein [Parasphingopyxis marina]|uniref:ComF family protein n=1 Tax=Parasphingopyxis marina TaxID=2761622 RepID=A0A842I2V3_9SPHN|nr:ComF family protein [Parasphingopyxis marina]MBC2778194.1 ComF family protein [Parasphingopyxis marina]